MVVADEVQRPMNDEMRPMGAEALLLLTGLGTQHLWADHQVSQRTRLIRRSGDGQLGNRERQHVRRLIPSPEPRIEAAAFGRPDDGHSDLTSSGSAT